MAHWTIVQTWKNTKTGEIKTAGELITANDRYFRINRVSLCCATFDVRTESGEVWRRIVDLK